MMKLDQKNNLHSKYKNKVPEIIEQESESDSLKNRTITLTSSCKNLSQKHSVGASSIQVSALGRSSNNSENSGNEESEPEQRNEPIKLENKLTQNVDQLSKALLPQNINIKPIDPEINA